MTADELAAYRGRMIADYAAALVRDAGLDAGEAQHKAETDTAAQWPGAEAPAGDVLAVVEADGEAVGHVWFAESSRNDRRTLFVNDVEIHERHRGRGLGRAAMGLIEDEARRRGIDRVELNVFGGNVAARSLYRSLGYQEVAVGMRKLLAPGDDRGTEAP
jgi:ribosomal protein S18 acetylase RimI-like enzyme